MSKDPVRDVKKESLDRVARGGGWSNKAVFLVVSYRTYRSPGFRLNLLGLRPVRNVKEKE